MVKPRKNHRVQKSPDKVVGERASQLAELFARHFRDGVLLPPGKTFGRVRKPWNLLGSNVGHFLELSWQRWTELSEGQMQGWNHLARESGIDPNELCEAYREAFREHKPSKNGKRTPNGIVYTPSRAAIESNPGRAIPRILSALHLLGAALNDPKIVDPGLEGFASADSIWMDEGITRSRLSEGKAAGKIKWKPAPTKMKDSHGRAVRILYNVEDAKSYV